MSVDEMKQLNDSVNCVLRKYGLSRKFAKQLKDCFVQQNTIQTAALKLDVDETTATYYYYRISMDLLHNALEQN